MSIETKCPECGARNKNPDEKEGKKATCPKCEAQYVVGGSGSKKKADEGNVRTAPSKARAGRAVDDDDDDKPKSKSRRSRDEDDDEEDEKPKAKSKSRPSRDDDDDDDDTPSRKPVKKSGGSSLIWILGGVAALLLLICGGVVGGVWYVGYRAKKAMVAGINDFDQKMQEDMKKNGGFPAGPDGNPMGGNPIIFGNSTKDINDALARLKSGKAQDRRSGADWLAGHQLDASRQNEVSAALEPLLDDSDTNVRQSVMAALKVWATAANVPAIVKILKANTSTGQPPSAIQSNAIAILGRFPDASGAEAVVPFLANAFTNEDAKKSLAAMGPVAEKAVLTYYNHQDGGAQERARSLLVAYGTKPESIVRQCAIDLRSTNKDQRRNAARSLAETLAVIEPLRAEVSPALAGVLNDPDRDIASRAMTALGKWGNKEGADALAAQLGTARPQAGDALIVLGGQQTMNALVVATVKPYQQDQNKQVREEATRVLGKLTTENVGLDLILADLKSMDQRTRSDAAQKLIRMPVDPKRRAEVALALDPLVQNLAADTSSGTNAVKALVTWGTKDNTASLIAVLAAQGNFGDARREALNALSVTKDEKAIHAICLVYAGREHREVAKKALLAYGPEFGALIEVDISALSLQAVTNKEFGLAVECCQILGAVGTKKSLPALTQILAYAQNPKTKHQDLANNAIQAAAAINNRP